MILRKKDEEKEEAKLVTSSASATLSSAPSLDTKEERRRGNDESGSSKFHLLPPELLVNIFRQCIFFCASPGKLDELRLVSKSWNLIADSNSMWRWVACTFVPGLPLLRLETFFYQQQKNKHQQQQENSSLEEGEEKEQKVKPKQNKDSEEEKKENEEVDSIEALLELTSKYSFPNSPFANEILLKPRESVGPELSRTEVIKLHNERVRFVREFHQYVLVEHQRRYTVNLFITFALLALSVCSLTFVVAIELNSVSDNNNNNNNTNSEWSHVFSVDSAFKLLWIALGLGCAAVVTNIIMKAHYEPQPLLQRVLSHWKTISASVVLLSFVVLVFMFPLYAVQRNVSACWGTKGGILWSEAGCLEFSWITGCLPLVAALVLWQLVVFHNNTTQNSLQHTLLMPEENNNNNVDPSSSSSSSPTAAAAAAAGGGTPTSTRSSPQMRYYNFNYSPFTGRSNNNNSNSVRQQQQQEHVPQTEQEQEQESERRNVIRRERQRESDGPVVMRLFDDSPISSPNVLLDFDFSGAQTGEDDQEDGTATTTGGGGGTTLLFGFDSADAGSADWLGHVAHAFSNLTPFALGLGVFLFALYLETGMTPLLIISAVPFLMCFFILIGLFAVDFSVGGSIADGIAVLGLILLCCAPLTAFFFPVRGLTGLPLIIALSATFVGYAQKTWALIRTVDELGASF